MTGARGLVGAALTKRLRDAGHETAGYSMPRLPAKEGLQTLPDLEANAFEGCDAVVHLAGENIAGRWTRAKKAKIWNSRVLGTRALTETLCKLENPPRVLISASAIGIYGDRGDELLTETSEPGIGFFPDLARQWEAATAPAAEAGIRVVLPRFGVVLSGRGGALAQMLPPFKLGLGGRIGSGEQYWSWISLDDLVTLLIQALTDAGTSGVYNLVAPESVTNAEFTRTLGEVLKRPAVVPVPAFALRAVYGEMVDAALLASARVVPVRLGESGFMYQHPDLQSALKAALSSAQ